MKGKEGAESGEDEAESGGARGEEETRWRKDKGWRRLGQVEEDEGQKKGTGEKKEMQKEEEKEEADSEN